MVGTLCVKLIVTRMPFPSALSTLKHFLITELARIFFALRLPAFGDIDEGDDAIRSIATGSLFPPVHVGHACPDLSANATRPQPLS